jgi:hypothetical protein
VMVAVTHMEAKLSRTHLNIGLIYDAFR